MRRSLLVLVALLLAIPAPGVAQSRNPSGLWVGLNAGGGWGRIGCDLCVTGRELGYSGALNFGGTIRRGFLVGAEIGGWTFEQDQARQTIGSLSGLITMYPRPGRSGVFVRGGMGVHYTKVTQEDEDVDATTFGVQVGAGYELDISPGWALVNSINVLASSFGSLKAGDETIADDVSNTIVRFSVGVKRH